MSCVFHFDLRSLSPTVPSSRPVSLLFLRIRTRMALPEPSPARSSPDKTENTGTTIVITCPLFFDGAANLGRSFPGGLFLYSFSLVNQSSALRYVVAQADHPTKRRKLRVLTVFPRLSHSSLSSETATRRLASKFMHISIRPNHFLRLIRVTCICPCVRASPRH